MDNSPMNMASVDQWQFLNSGFHSGHYNMRLDEFLAERLLSRRGPPTLRVYGWKPYAISLGYNQRNNDFDVVRCAADGIDLVRRPTGGRAILHAEELTYSVTMFSQGKTINDAYCEISRALLSGLQLLGADAEVTQAQPNLPQFYRSRTSIPCFASSTRYEIQYRGKKLVGSAQRRFVASGGDEVVLQHGSILLGPDHKRLSEFVKAESEEIRAALRETLETKTTELDSVLGRKIPFDEAASALKRGFEKAWNIAFTEITDDDLHALLETEPAVNN
jgi:lipoyl(octanoyl) transferase